MPTDIDTDYDPNPPALPGTVRELKSLIVKLREQARNARSDADVRMLTSKIAQITRQYRIQHHIGVPTSLVSQAVELDSQFARRPHIDLLSDRVADAVRDVERGHSRQLAVSMPPRSGKSTLLSVHGPLWFLRRHPEWKVVLASHDSSLSIAWARQIRRVIEQKPELGIALAPDGGAGSHYQTVEGGGMYACSTRSGLTGRGARVLIIDDPVKDFVDAHSALQRQNLWDWWLSVALTRLEPPFLILVVMTRWHEDDFVGRLLSEDHEGDPKDWERIVLPAIAEDFGVDPDLAGPDQRDPLGRAPGQPLLSPLLEETDEQALARWAKVRQSVGTYTFSAMYLQRPAPAKGAIFDSGWWRYWSRDPSKATEDGRVVHLDPGTLVGGRWLDSWDCSFKATAGATAGASGGSGSWVVGQRWVRNGPRRYLIAQQRKRWSFTQTLARMDVWARTDDPIESPCGHLVHQRLIEDAANGPAIMDVLDERLSGIKPVRATTSKESRARAVTPEIESGHVYLPHPSDPGNEWVADLLSELRNFPHDMADDQVDALTQALTELRDSGRGGITVPGRLAAGMGTNPSNLVSLANRSITRAAHSDLGRRRATGA